MNQQASTGTRRSLAGKVAALRWALVVVALGPGCLARAADNSGPTIELNKLEPQAKSCRAYFVIDNTGPMAFQSLKLDLVLFRTDGVIDRRLALDLSPIRPNKKSVKLFELNDLPCDSLGSILLNEVTDCRDPAGPVVECADKLKLSSRAAASFSK